MKPARVHVLGNLCRDTTLGVARFPRPGETLVATARHAGLGGKGLNQAVAAARAGAGVALHAAVGPGEAAGLAAELAGEPGLDLHLVEGEAATDGSVILVRPDGENAIVSACAAARGFDPLAGGALAGTAPGDVLLLQGNLRPATTLLCLREGRRRGALTVLNPSPLWDDPWPDWRDVDLLVANAGELAALAGEGDPARGAAALLAAGVGAVAVTLGAAGALYRDAEAEIAIPAPPVAPRDASGAGDVFCGVLAGGLARGVARAEALARATAAASLSVTRPGALASCPTAAEIGALPLPEPIRRRP